MMNRIHAQLEGAETTANVEMPMELSGMSHVGRKPTTTQRIGSTPSGIDLEAPKVAPRPTPPEFAYTPTAGVTNTQNAPPGYHFMPDGTLMSDANHGLGSIEKPKIGRKGLGSATKTLGLIAAGGVVLYGSYMGYKYFSEGDDE